MKRYPKAKIVLASIIVLGATVVAYCMYAQSVKLWPFAKKSNNSIDTSAQTTSSTPSAQTGFTEGSSRDIGNSIHEDEGEGGIIDSNGTPSTTTSHPRSSETNEITIYLPLDDSSVSSGQEISGTSKLSTINYRIIDNKTGVIGSGALKVVDGKFSGKLSFITRATEGRIDIFASRPDGVEYSNIEIPVRFNQ